ncbi:E3 ubiquitin-protein ligase RDUF2-like [Phragmites australis]|uniref:E3 ubiquitin-protein ligase RDUF2-like n=1 Tax=Phragmites australis TaxID=29695 RepID=UPI002D780145|nr:E3 ubiquitin-protein ligase RDUF2-like [Phragmites australis]
MDAARAAPLAASDGQGNRSRHPVVLGGRACIAEESRSDPPPADGQDYDEEEELRAFIRGPRVPLVPMRNHLFFGTAVDWIIREDHEAEEERNHSYKRARVPASSKAIIGLKEARAGDAGLQAVCAVCLQDFDAEDKLRAMPCSHAFHQDCIFGWLRVNHVCPLCRHALPTQQQDDDDENYQQASTPVPEEA